MNVSHRPSGSRAQAIVRPAALHPFALWLLVALALLLMSVPRLGAQDLLANARSLYASAAYDEALSTLQRLSTEQRGLPSTTVRELEEYRFLCLVALGRLPEARESMAAAIVADPLYKLDAHATSPRILSTFQDVRRDVLPGLTGELYNVAKLAFDQQQYAKAETGFKTVLTLIDDPDVQGKHAELSTRVRGFLDLTSSALQAASAPPVAAKVDAPPAPAPVRRVVFTPPVAIRQVVPPMPPDLARFGATRTGVLEISIDETGKVEAAVFTQGIHPIYDNQVLTATRSWRYAPALSDGVPVKFKKTLKVSMTPAQQ